MNIKDAPIESYESDADDSDTSTDDSKSTKLIVEADDDMDIDVDESIESDESDIESEVDTDVEENMPPSNLETSMTRQEMDVDEDDDDDDDEDYLQKFDENLKQNIIGDYHPELIQHNDEEVETLCKVIRDEDGVVIDPLHKTLPFITKYEKARIIGERAKQINSGAKPFIKVEKHIIDGYLIALREFEEKKIPFIVRRPLPNGCSEYWKLADLQFLD